MLRPRLIPSLLLHENGLVKTVNFKNPKYVGDPINAVRIFNEKEVDELAIFDIDSTILKKEPNFALLEKLASQSRMPLCYGGGVKSIEQARTISSLGIEKIAISSAIIENPNLVTDIAESLGSQSVVVVLDVRKRRFGGYEIYTHNGKKPTGVNPCDLAQRLEKLGAGEIIINSIDRDGLMSGFDLKLIDSIVEKVSLPITVLGGAGSLDHIKQVISKHDIIGVSAGSLFVFRGRYKAVLINYPTRSEKDELFSIRM
jgi:imidazole glycerol-phosphate synthase subunit HisF